MVSTAVQIWYITCTTKALRNGYLVITHLSGPAGTWSYSEVVAWIDSGRHRFFTSDGVKTAEIMVLPGTYARYLQTMSDGVLSNNLEELPVCR